MSFKATKEKKNSLRLLTFEVKVELVTNLILALTVRFLQLTVKKINK